MRIITLHVGHDANITTYDSDSNIMEYYKVERLCNIKHCDLNDPHVNDMFTKFLDFNPDRLYCCQGPSYKPDSTGLQLHGRYSDLFNVTPLSDTPELYQLANRLICQFINNLNINYENVYWVQHDYCHILSSWVLGKSDYGVSLDGGCEDYNSCLILKTPFNIDKTEILYNSRKLNMGHIMIMIGHHQLALDSAAIDTAGKVMGICAYGSQRNDIFNSAEHDKLEEDFTATMLLKSGQFGSIVDTNTNTFTSDGLDFISSMHRTWSNKVIQLFAEYIPMYRSVTFSGGCAQNTLTNYALSLLYSKLNVVPHCYDGGLSVGAMGFALMHNGIPFPTVDNFPYIQKDESTESPSLSTIQRVAKLLADGKIVGWYQGHGEIGPRALGNRSILMNPAIADGKDILNSRVKHREPWRPFAPSVLESEVHKWFEVSKGYQSKYMLYAIPASTENAHLIPSVVHNDMSSRIQTVSENDNNIFHQLLTEFNKLTGIPMLLNTSLNDGGYPIMGKKIQAIEMLQTSDLDAVCVGNIITYKND